VDRPTEKSSASSAVGVLTGPVQSDEVGLLLERKFGLLTPEPTAGLRDFHPLAGAHTDQVGLELCNHRESVEQKPSDRIGRVVDWTAEAEPYPPRLVSSSTMSPASGSDRASRSSLVTTRLSPARQAAIASRKPGRLAVSCRR